VNNLFQQLKYCANIVFDGRFKSFSGYFVDGVKQGPGEGVYFDGVKVLAEFAHGHPHGRAILRFARSKGYRDKYVLYQRGQRVKWEHENVQLLKQLTRQVSKVA
jgi:hypothetical protein